MLLDKLHNPQSNQSGKVLEEMVHSLDSKLLSLHLSQQVVQEQYWLQRLVLQLIQVQLLLRTY